MYFFLFLTCSFQLRRRAARLRPGLGRWGVCHQAEKEDGDQFPAVWGDDWPSGERQWTAGIFRKQTHNTPYAPTCSDCRRWKPVIITAHFCKDSPPTSYELVFLIKRSPSLCLAAREPSGGQTATEGGRRAHQGGLWILEPQEEKQQGQRPDPQCEAGETRRLQHQRPVCGLPTADGKDANQEGQSSLCFGGSLKAAIINSYISPLLWKTQQQEVVQS